MTHLRFSPADYRSLCRFCRPPLPVGRDLLTFKRLLVTSLAEAHADLAERIAELNGHQLGALHDHFQGLAVAGRPKGGWHGLSEEELQAVAEACDFFLHPVRFVRHLRMALVANLRDLFPDLAKKVARLSERQFGRLYEHVRERGSGNG